MALNPNVNYPTRTTAPDSDYPYGGAQNVTAPNDGTGTPWEADLINDVFGFQQSLLDAAGIVPNGNPDTVQSSQYLQALDAVVNAGLASYLPINGSLPMTGALTCQNAVTINNSFNRKVVLASQNDGSLTLTAVNNTVMYMQGNAGAGGAVQIYYGGGGGANISQLACWLGYTKVRSLRVGDPVNTVNGDFQINIPSNAEQPNVKFQTKGLQFNGNITKTFFEILAEDVIIGCQETAKLVKLVNASTVVAQTSTPALGGLFVNNTLTGGGLERVLTESDAGGGSSNFFAGAEPNLTDTGAALLVGGVDADTFPHIEIGPTIIQSKVNATTPNDLALNQLGGDTYIYGEVNVQMLVQDVTNQTVFTFKNLADFDFSPMLDIQRNSLSRFKVLPHLIDIVPHFGDINQIRFRNTADSSTVFTIGPIGDGNSNSAIQTPNEVEVFAEDGNGGGVWDSLLTHKTNGSILVRHGNDTSNSARVLNLRDQANYYVAGDETIAGTGLAVLPMTGAYRVLNGSVYNFTAFMKFSFSTSGGIKFNMAIPAGGIDYVLTYTDNTGVKTSTSGISDLDSFILAIPAASFSANQVYFLKVEGTFRPTATGNVSVGFGQTTNDGLSTIYEGSWIRYEYMNP